MKSASKMKAGWMCLQLLILLLGAKIVHNLPITLSANETPTISSNEYYESFNLQPIIVKIDSKEAVAPANTVPALKTENKEVLFEAPWLRNFWTNFKFFFTNDLPNFVKKVAAKCNPMPSILKAIDSVERSRTWVGISSFFTRIYERLAEISGCMFKDLRRTKMN